ncbi:hypothetical protein L2E82_48156 [Cichorium intybus]|uniref:Uncharacterized protein n=1 Tax=Cichorium intybus TaxID=13427 RepID=A0ACB8YY85_CICIN|nr:hypothetical protein L2E82_48156 [Cichorium intybus]
MAGGSGVDDNHFTTAPPCNFNGKKKERECKGMMPSTLAVERRDREERQKERERHKIMPLRSCRRSLPLSQVGASWAAFENLLLDASGCLKVSDFGLTALPQQVRVCGDDLIWIFE